MNTFALSSTPYANSTYCPIKCVFASDFPAHANFATAWPWTNDSCIASKCTDAGHFITCGHYDAYGGQCQQSVSDCFSTEFGVQYLTSGGVRTHCTSFAGLVSMILLVAVAAVVCAGP